MSGEITHRKIGRGFERNLDAGPMVGSFELHLRAEKKSPKTIRSYIEAAPWLARSTCCLLASVTGPT